MSNVQVVVWEAAGRLLLVFYISYSSFLMLNGWRDFCSGCLTILAWLVLRDDRKVFAVKLV